MPKSWTTRGDRTDVLQTKPHYKKLGGEKGVDHGITHTHEWHHNVDREENVHEGIVERKTRLPTYAEVQNIMNGKAIKMK